MNAIFDKYKDNLDSLILPYDSFKPFSDLTENGLNPEYMQTAVSRAEQLLDKEYPILPASVYMQYKRNGNRSVYEGIYFSRRSMVFGFMLAELYERKGRFTDKLIDGVWAILEESSWVIPAHNQSHSGKSDPLTYAYGRDVDYIDLFSAETGSLMAWVWYLCGEILDPQTDIIRSRILYELNRRIIEPYMTNDAHWWMGFMGNTLNNWTPWIISNVLTVCALCFDDGGLRVAVTKRAMTILDNFTRNYHSDGGCDEGPSYWGVAGASYFDCLELLSDMSGGKIDVFGDPLICAMGEYIAKVNISGRSYLNFADCPAGVSPDMYMIERFGRRCGSETLRAFAASKINSESLIPTVSAYNTIYRVLKNLSSSKPAPAEYICRKKVWFDGIQVMAVREMQSDSEGLYLAAKGGFNAESHNHNDVGSFIVYADGKPLFIDVGVGTYCADTFNQNRYKIWTMQSQYHNIPTINGHMQPPGGQYKATDVVYDEESGGLSMSLKSAYPADSGIIDYKRSFALENGKILITDEIALDGGGKVEFNLITADKPDISGSNIITLNGRAVHYDCAFTAELDEIELKDKKIAGSWRREKLYRIRLASPEGFEKGRFALIIE